MSVMNESEDIVCEKSRKEGWYILRGGSPDFILLKFRDGEICDDKAVEVKSANSKLDVNQQLFKMFLEKHGVKYEVARVKRDQSIDIDAVKGSSIEYKVLTTAEFNSMRELPSHQLLSNAQEVAKRSVSPELYREVRNSGYGMEELLRWALNYKRKYGDMLPGTLAPTHIIRCCIDETHVVTDTVDVTRIQPTNVLDSHTVLLTNPCKECTNKLLQS